MDKNAHLQKYMRICPKIIFFLGAVGRCASPLLFFFLDFLGLAFFILFFFFFFICFN